MNANITLKNVSIVLGIIVTTGGIFLGLLDIYISHKLSDVKELQTATVTKIDLLMEERMAKMERTELYNRFNEVLKGSPSSEDNYSLDRYMNPTEETKPASKK